MFTTAILVAVGGSAETTGIVCCFGSIASLACSLIAAFRVFSSSSLLVTSCFCCCCSRFSSSISSRSCWALPSISWKTASSMPRKYFLNTLIPNFLLVRLRGVVPSLSDTSVMYAFTFTAPFLFGFSLKLTKDTVWFGWLGCITHICLKRGCPGTVLSMSYRASVMMSVSSS